MLNRARSLHIEHVSPAGLMRRGISRRPGMPTGTKPPPSRSCAGGSSRANLMRDSSSRTSRLRCSKLRCSTNGSTPAARPSTRRSPVPAPRARRRTTTARSASYRTRGPALALMIPIKDKEGSPGCARRVPSPPRCLSRSSPWCGPVITTMDLDQRRAAPKSRALGSAQRLITVISTVRAATRRTPASRSTRRSSTESLLQARPARGRHRLPRHRPRVQRLHRRQRLHGPVRPVSPEGREAPPGHPRGARPGIRAAQVGNRIGDISSRSRPCRAARLQRRRDMVGHGVGVAMHEPPEIPNFGARHRREDKARDDPRHRADGQPRAATPPGRCRRLDGRRADGSPSAHFEHTVLTTDKGPKSSRSRALVPARSA
jgi:hypothetical protein